MIATTTKSAATGAELLHRTTKAKSRKPTVVVKVHTRRRAEKAIAAIAAAFLPVASYVIAHVEAPTNPALYALVVAALAYSAPTLASWSKTWAGHILKAWGFTVLLEGVMVFSHILALNLTGLAILVTINAFAAYGKAAR